MITESLKKYIEENILPIYANFDKGHNIIHVTNVINASLKLADNYPIVNKDMVYTIAAYHDVGIIEGRERHNITSGEILIKDIQLKEWFSEDEILIMRDAVEDHRASSKHKPRTIYGLIVAEADREIDIKRILHRTILFGLSHYPELSKEEQYERFHEHLLEKYAEGGYLKLYLPESDNAQKLKELQKIIADKKSLRNLFDTIYLEETNK